MEITRRLLVLSLAAILVIHVYTVAAQGRVSQVIRDSCEQMTHPDFCISVLSSDPRSWDHKTPDQLAFLAILISNEKTKESLSHISDVEKKTTDSLVKKILNFCIEQYELGPVGGTESALKEFNDGEKRLAAISLSSVFPPVDDCNNAFQYPPYPANAIGETNELVEKYCFVALDLVHLVGGH